MSRSHRSYMFWHWVVVACVLLCMLLPIGVLLFSYRPTSGVVTDTKIRPGHHQNRFYNFGNGLKVFPVWIPEQQWVEVRNDADGQCYWLPVSGERRWQKGER